MSGHIERRSGRYLLLLGLPNFGLALSIGVVTTVLPIVLSRFTDSSTLIGLVIGGEGAFAVVLPIFIGAWSDRLDTRIGGRLPFMLFGAVLGAASLALIPLAGSLLVVAVFVATFYIAYFTYFPPYNASYPDLVPKDQAGRSQGGQGFWRGLGLLGAVAGGALLVDVSHWLPFLVAAGALLSCTAAFVALAGYTRRVPGSRAQTPSAERALVQGWRLVSSGPSIRNLLLANVLWEFSLASLRSFILLYLVRGLFLSYPQASLGIGVVAAALVVASLVAGRIGDRFGVRRTMLVAVAFYGLGLLAPAITTSLWFIGATLPFVAFGGSVVNTLPYGLLIKLLPDTAHGAASGLFSVSRGLGVMAGPLVTGALIDILRPWLPDTAGYGAMWFSVAGSMLLSLIFLRRVELDEQRLDELAAASATAHPQPVTTID